MQMCIYTVPAHTHALSPHIHAHTQSDPPPSLHREEIMAEDRCVTDEDTGVEECAGADGGWGRTKLRMMLKVVQAGILGDTPSWLPEVSMAQ